MKRWLSLILVLSFCFQPGFAGLNSIQKAGVKQNSVYSPRREVQDSMTASSTDRHSGPKVFPSQRDGTLQIALVDSSMNGFGMIVPSTRPLEIEDGNYFYVYRQWAGATETSGQIGAAYSEDGTNWNIYTNVNNGMGIGRYPSALGNSDYPYAIWNEYTGEGAGYGGRPYYIYDEFGWAGYSASSPYDVDATWTSDKDLWVGSPDHSFDANTSTDYFNIVYADWTRNDSYLFHSEAYSDGYVAYGAELKVIDVNNDMVAPSSGGSYTSSPTLDINDDGIGYVGVTTYFVGGDQGTSSYSNRHTIALKQTTDFGATWSGGQNGSNYYYVPDIVWNFMLASGTFPQTYYDACGDTTYNFDELFATYDFNMKVDSQGNPHFIVGVLPSGGGYVYPGIIPENGFYHIWIDKDYLSDPGQVNTPTGWNYAFVGSAQNSWMWNTAGGNSYWQTTFPSLAISEESDDVMYVVSSMVVPGPADDPTPDDTCNTDASYPQWSEDVIIFRSTDGGVTWDSTNVTNTPDPDPNDEDSPEEVSAHAAATGATNTSVYLCYQMPDFPYGSTTGSLDDADYKNRVYAGRYDYPYVGTDQEYAVPTNFKLEQAYPNPFNPSTTIGYKIAKTSQVSLRIYDLMGHEIQTLVNGIQSPNQYSVVWDGKDARGHQVASGVYLYRLETDGSSQMRKMLLLK